MEIVCFYQFLGKYDFLKYFGFEQKIECEGDTCSISYKRI